MIAIAASATRDLKTAAPGELWFSGLFEAARLTGSSKNDQPWHFIAVERPETLKALSEVATSGRYVGEAAFAVAVAVRSDSIYGVSDGSRAVQSMVLAAWEEGVGSNWIGFANLEPVE